MSALILVWCGVLCGDPAVGPVDDDAVESEGQAAPVASPDERVRPPRRSDRTIFDLDGVGEPRRRTPLDGPERARVDALDRARQEDPSAEKLGAARPRQLRARSPVAAALLGGLVGLGTGHYYASSAEQGAIFTAVDVALWAGLVTTVWAFNQKVIRNDFRTQVSLARDEREMTDLEGRLFTAAWALGATLVATHAAQAFTAHGAAKRTNRTLDSFAYVPLEAGAY